MATVGSFNTRQVGAGSEAHGAAATPQESVPHRGLKHRRLPVSAVSDGDTLGAAQGIPARTIEVAWTPDSTGEEANATVSSGTVTFHTDGVTSYAGFLHLWYAEG